MNKKANSLNRDIKPDLKHDTLEYAAPHEGEDKQDNDDPNREEDAITAEELDFIQADSPEAQAAALSTVETDRLATNDLIFDEDDIDDSSDLENAVDDSDTL